MAIYQIFVKLIDGQTKCLQISSPTITGETLKDHLFVKTRIPQTLQRVITGSRVIFDETIISASADGFFPSCVLLLRLAGGKGGFGSLLRGAATKAGQKKTNNFDACRDMSGRRLRHVNAEKKLEEWMAEAEGRRLEKLAEQFLKKKAKDVKKKASVDVDKYLEKYREDSAKSMEEVEESVRQSFDVYQNLKRKICPKPDGSSKRVKIWLGKNKLAESCSEDDDSDDSDLDLDEAEKKSVVLDDGNQLIQNKVIDKRSSSVTSSGISSDGDSSSGVSDQSNLDHENIKLLDHASFGNTFEQGNLVELNEKPAKKFQYTECCQILEKSLSSGGSSETETMLSASISLKKTENDELKTEVHSQIEPKISVETVIQAIESPGLKEPLCFNMYNSAKELEVLGMDGLKMELQARGLKCGGTLPERASRLFLLKSTPLELLPKKLFAKPSGLSV